MVRMLIPLLALLGGAHRAEVASIELENLVRLSDLVVVGQVIDVRTVSRGIPDLPIAEVRVDTVLKGSPETSRALFVAAGSWTCDTTEAVRGERGLFFLRREPEKEQLRRAVEDAFGPGELLRVQWSGRGRMPLRDVDGRAFATYWTDVVMPRDLENIPGPQREYESFIRSAPLDQLGRRIATFVEAQAEPWLRFSLEARSGEPAKAWSIRGDGTCLLESSGNPPPAPRTARLEDEILFGLGIAFGAQDRDAPFLPPVLDSSSSGGRRGTLELLWREELHAIPIRAQAFEPSSDEDVRRYGNLLRAWSELYTADL